MLESESACVVLQDQVSTEVLRAGERAVAYACVQFQVPDLGATKRRPLLGQLTRGHPTLFILPSAGLVDTLSGARIPTRRSKASAESLTMTTW